MTTSLSHLDSLLLTSEQLHEQGLSDYKIAQLVKNHQLLKPRRGVYIWNTHYQNLKAWEKYSLEILAFSKVSSSAVFSHQSAASIYSLATLVVPEKIHLYTPPSSRGNSRNVIKHAMPPDSLSLVTTTQGLTTTSLPLTVRDCAATTPLRFGVSIADSALHLHSLSVQELQAELKNYSGRNKKRVWQVADLMSPLAESPGETLTRLILEDLKVEYIEQFELRVDGEIFRGDFFVKGSNIIVEFDGRMKYTDYQPTDQALIRERSREKKLQRLGYQVFRVEWNDVFYRAETVKRQLARFLM